MSKRVVLKSVLKAFIRTFNAQSYVNQIFLVKITRNKEYDWSMKFVLN